MSALLNPAGTGDPVRAITRTSLGQLDMRFCVEAPHLARVRHIVREHLRWWNVSNGTSDRVLLAVNELLTNVLEHARPDVHGRRNASLLVQHVRDGVTAIVRDADPYTPAPVSARPLDESGRGLALVHALVDDSSVSGTTNGKDMWVFIAEPVPLDEQHEEIHR
ncbi:ATP-binding protein [Streptomyces sp. NPDC057445]|uniref:ATP-binding protein n=1 Tax=Streptomyces sp. NPDC057445 TaxID=3346136 RepID=UPI0036C7EE69